MRRTLSKCPFLGEAENRDSDDVANAMCGKMGGVAMGVDQMVYTIEN